MAAGSSLHPQSLQCLLPPTSTHKTSVITLAPLP